METYNGFVVGSKVIYRKIARRIYMDHGEIRDMTEGYVLPKPTDDPDFPRDAVMVDFTNYGKGKIDRRCLESIL